VRTAIGLGFHNISGHQSSIDELSGHFYRVMPGHPLASISAATPGYPASDEPDMEYDDYKVNLNTMMIIK
jgi:hypothetical protein